MGHPEKKLEGIVTTLQAPLGAEAKLLPSGPALAGRGNIVPRPRAAEPVSALQGNLTLRGACRAVEGDAGCPWEQLWDCAGWAEGGR